ncbi:hypothetical protein Tco_1355940, partial [Tanacetum coccineum]
YCMRRSSTKELLTPFKDPEREFRSSRKLFKTLNQFLKELRDNTFSGLDHEDANEHIEKVLEIVELLHEVILFYNGLNVPTGQILYPKGAIPTKTTTDAKDVKNVKDPTTPKISLSRKKVKPSKKLTTLSLVDLSKEGDIEQQLWDSTKGTMKTLQIRASTNAAVRNQGASIKTLEIQIRQISKVIQERGFGSLPSSTEANPRDHVKSISTTAEADSNPIRRIGSPQYAVSTSQMTIPFPSRLNDYYCEGKKGSYGP